MSTISFFSWCPKIRPAVLDSSPVGLDPSTAKEKEAGEVGMRAARGSPPAGHRPLPLAAELRLRAAEVRSWTAKDEHEANTFSPAWPATADCDTPSKAGCCAAPIPGDHGVSPSGCNFEVTTRRTPSSSARLLSNVKSGVINQRLRLFGDLHVSSFVLQMIGQKSRTMRQAYFTARPSPHFWKKVSKMDRAIKRFLLRNIVEQAAGRDVQEACVHEGYILPKLYTKVYHCVSCAIHAHIVRVCSRENRRNPDPLQRLRRRARSCSCCRRPWWCRRSQRDALLGAGWKAMSPARRQCAAVRFVVSCRHCGGWGRAAGGASGAAGRLGESCQRCLLDFGGIDPGVSWLDSD